MHHFSQHSIQQLLGYFGLDQSGGPADRHYDPQSPGAALAWLKRHDIECFRVPVVIKLIISVGLQWKSLRPIGHISLSKGGVDLDAKVSCQKAFILSNQLVACWMMTECSGLHQDVNCMCCWKQTRTVFRSHFYSRPLSIRPHTTNWSLMLPSLFMIRYYSLVSQCCIL